MIGRLLGRVVDEGEGGVLIVDVGGVGYEVIAPLGTRGQAEVEDGTLLLHIHTHVREDALQLFGFASGTHREVFRSLIAIANVGPKLALAVLSAISIEDLRVVIERGEVGRLVAIPGVGKKTAERLVLELKGKLPMGSSPLRVKAAAAAVSATKAELLHSALVRMGYRSAEADRAVGALGDRVNDQAVLADLMREALAELAL